MNARIRIFAISSCTSPSLAKYSEKIWKNNYFWWQAGLYMHCLFDGEYSKTLKNVVYDFMVLFVHFLFCSSLNLQKFHFFLFCKLYEKFELLLLWNFM